jgi:hypothetical protein
MFPVDKSFPVSGGVSRWDILCKIFDVSNFEQNGQQICLYI